MPDVTGRAKSGMRRRDFLKATGVAATAIFLGGGLAPILGGCGPAVSRGALKRKVMVLGIDGLDPVLLGRFVGEGALPTFEGLLRTHWFGHLGTSTPPQSPVAWSNFITGTNPGGHGIYDFIHRDAETYFPYLSTSRTEPPEPAFIIGNWAVPLSGGRVELLRRGPTFWKMLEEHGIPATVFKVPVNFPPTESRARTISGLGTPDILGTYGTFSYFTDDPPDGWQDFSGGKVFPVEIVRHSFRASLTGPRNTYRVGSPRSEVEFTVHRDPANAVVKIAIQGQELLLQEGEWSDWVRVRFTMVPHVVHVSGICRFYLKQVHPTFGLYVTPINIDPADPAMPISTPSSYSRELCDRVGPFYTKGFPEDTKALSNGVFTDEEYLDQADYVLAERVRLLEYELERFREGFFFFYFSSIDQNTHMMWRSMDVNHPLHDHGAPARVKSAVRRYYQGMDAAVRIALGRVDAETTFCIMSDHGFAPFYREFNVNSWLLDTGYLSLLDPSQRADTEFLDKVDWSGTRAYALGLNSVYVNRAGRESEGIVRPREAEALVDELARRLEAVVDPLTGQKVLAHAYKGREAFSGPYAGAAPDIVLGYNWGYRISDEAALGEFPEEMLRNREDKWSGDHCIDPSLVPGVLLVNREVVVRNPTLCDLAPTILSEFGIPAPPEMTGRELLQLA